MFAPRGPFYISWFVIAVIVNAVYRETFVCPVSDIVFKLREVIGPIRANGNAAGPVVAVILVFWV